MSTTELDPRSRPLEPRRLWFGAAGPAVAWVLLGIIDIVITWRACMTQEDYGVPVPRPDVRLLYFGAALLLLAISAAAGWISYRNWRYLSGNQHVLGPHAVERRQFLALGGLIVAFTMGAGIFWLALPPLFLDLCWRAK